MIRSAPLVLRRYTGSEWHGGSRQPWTSYATPIWSDYAKELDVPEPSFFADGNLTFVFSDKVLRARHINPETSPETMRIFVVSGDLSDDDYNVISSGFSALVIKIRDTPRVQIVVPLLFLLAGGDEAPGFKPTFDLDRVGGGVWCNAEDAARARMGFSRHIWQEGLIDDQKYKNCSEEAEKAAEQCLADMEKLAATSADQETVTLPSGDTYKTPDLAVAHQMIGFATPKALRDDWMDYVSIYVNGRLQSLESECVRCPYNLRRGTSYHCAPCFFNCKRVAGSGRSLFGLRPNDLFSLKSFEPAARELEGFRVFSEKPTAAMPYAHSKGYDAYRMIASRWDSMAAQLNKLSKSASKSVVTRRMHDSVCVNCVFKHTEGGCRLASGAQCFGPYKGEDLLQQVDPSKALRKPKDIDWIFCLRSRDGYGYANGNCWAKYEMFPWLKDEITRQLAFLWTKTSDQVTGKDVMLATDGWSDRPVIQPLTGGKHVVIGVRYDILSAKSKTSSGGKSSMPNALIISLQQLQELVSHKKLTRSAWLEGELAKAGFWPELCRALLHRSILTKESIVEGSFSPDVPSLHVGQLLRQGPDGNSMELKSSRGFRLLHDARAGCYDGITASHLLRVRERNNYCITADVTLMDTVLSVSPEPEHDFLPEERKKENLWTRTMALKQK